jgi:heat shock protein 1/8
MTQPATNQIAVGIDLGTTYSCVGVCLKSRVKIIPNTDNGLLTTPSYVAFTEDGPLVGDNARLSDTDPGDTVYAVKRIIGRRFLEPCVASLRKNWPFEVKGQNEAAVIEVEVANNATKRVFYPEDVSALVLKQLKAQAEFYLGKKVTHAVITVPAYFNDSQRAATLKAAQLADLEVLKLLNEPTAAAIAFGFDKDLTEPREAKTLIFDFGGGTLDVSVLTIVLKPDELCPTRIEIHGVDGDSHLGGEDCDARLLEHVLLQLQQQHGKSFASVPRVVRTLRLACERAKLSLSLAQEAQLDLRAILPGVSLKIRRSKFEDLCADLFARALATVDKALDGVKLKAAQIDEVVMVGGSSRIPKVRTLLEGRFPGKVRDFDQDEAVATGAAIHAAQLLGRLNR